MAQLMSIKKNVDVQPGVGVPAIFHCSQGDKGTRIILGLLNNNDTYTIPEGTTAIIRGSRADGTLFTEITADIDTTTEIKFNLTEDMTSVAGPVECEAVMTSGTANIIGTANFIIDIEKSPASIGSVFPGTDAAETWLVNELTNLDIPGLDNESVVDAINSKMGSGLTDTQKSLFIEILRAALYSSDQSENIDALEESFTNTVVSITATLDLGGNTIYTDDSLDTLRQYLTVRAAYDDDTIQIVTGYTLSGTLTVGTSTIQVGYRDAYASVNVPVSQAVTRYTITNNLTGVTNSNTDTSIAEGNTYTGVLTADTTGYIPTSVSVKVGGTDVTSTVYDSSTHSITIENVQGDIIISAVGALDPTLPVYTLSAPMTETGVIDYTLFDQDQDYTIVYTVTTPANAGSVVISNKESVHQWFAFRSSSSYNYGTRYVRIFGGSDTTLNQDWQDRTVEGNQKIVITHDADGNSYGYWKQIVMMTGHESLGQGSKQLSVGTAEDIANTLNSNKIDVTISGGATLDDFKIYKRVLSNAEISEYVGWTVE